MGEFPDTGLNDWQDYLDELEGVQVAAREAAPDDRGSRLLRSVRDVASSVLGLGLGVGFPVMGAAIGCEVWPRPDRSSIPDSSRKSVSDPGRRRKRARTLAQRVDLLHEAPSERSGRELLALAWVRPLRQWQTIAAVEPVQKEQGDAGMVAGALLAQLESIARNALITGRARRRLGVAVSLPLDERKGPILARILAEGLPMTFGVAALWVEGLEQGFCHRAPEFVDFARERLMPPKRVLEEKRLSPLMNQWRELRNELAHGRHGVLAWRRYEELCHSLLGAPSVSRFLQPGGVQAEPPLVALLLARAKRRAAIARARLGEA